MRLELQMELLKPEIDIDYRRIIISYLKTVWYLKLY